MRRIVLLFPVLLLFCASVYAGEMSAPGPAVLSQRQAADVRVVMYMTSW